MAVVLLAAVKMARRLVTIPYGPEGVLKHSAVKGFCRVRNVGCCTRGGNMELNSDNELFSISFLIFVSVFRYFA